MGQILALFVAFGAFLVSLFVTWRVLSRLETIEELLRNIDKNFVDAVIEARKKAGS
jgi:HAMP domain-containing protein